MSTVVKQQSREHYPPNRIKLDIREKERIMERIFQSSVYKEFHKQWGAILSLQEINTL